MLIGPSTEAPVVLLKTWSPVLTIWTYCVAPTSPFVSGGAQLQLTPGKSIPSKLSPGLGMLGAESLLWTTGSCRAEREWPMRGLTTACLTGAAVGASGTTVLSRGETSF